MKPLLYGWLTSDVWGWQLGRERIGPSNPQKSDFGNSRRLGREPGARPGLAGRGAEGAGRRRSVVVVVPASSPGAATEPRRRRSVPEECVPALAAAIPTPRRLPLGLPATLGRGVRAPSARSFALLPWGPLRHGLGVGSAGSRGAGLRHRVPAGERPWARPTLRRPLDAGALQAAPGLGRTPGPGPVAARASRAGTSLTLVPRSGGAQRPNSWRSGGSDLGRHPSFLLLALVWCHWKIAAGRGEEFSSLFF